ncbi:MAG: hypothetical protein M3Q46_13395 [Verrucomicrobiota bacterium]|nr:hypothetical protein [Verrucomicrobiota bacterium]
MAGSHLGAGKHNTEIGHLGIANENRTIRIGAPKVQRQAFVAGISGAAVPEAWAWW